MSERLKSTENVSNEEVIEDLTKDLQESLNTHGNVEEFVISPNYSSSDESPVHLDPKQQAEKLIFNNDIPEDQKKKEEKKELDDEEEEDEESETDEVLLKDAELELTEDQKEERKIIAEELKVAGNNAFKDRQFDRSIEKYTEGLKICPLKYPEQRAILYCNRSAAKMKLKDYKHAIKDCTKAIELDDKYIKAYIRRAQSYEHTDKFDESLADYKKILEMDPSHLEARRATVRLPPLIEQKNEKLKTEMLGKLKDLGNMILKPFGLSTENFQLEQDPTSQGYKINFKQ